MTRTVREGRFSWSAGRARCPQRAARNSALRFYPKVTLQQTPFKTSPCLQFKTVARKDRVGSGQSARRQIGRPPKKPIHRLQDDSRPPLLPTAAWFAKIGDQPACVVGHCRTDFFRDQFDLFGAEAIEKEIRHHEIELAWCRFPFGYVATDERYRCDLRRAGTARPTLRLLQHARAGINTRHSRARLLPQELTQKATVAFAEQQGVPHRRCTIQKRRATALKFAAGEQPLHPAVMRGETIKAHVPPVPTRATPALRRRYRPGRRLGRPSRPRGWPGQ